MAAKILITGASGFVGSALVEESLLQGLQVYAGIRQTSSKKYLQDDRIHFVYLDFENESHMRQLLAEHQFDYIIHNAGATSAKNRATFFKVNAEYTISFANYALSEIPTLKKFTFTSSMASYGPADFSTDAEVNHNQVPHPVTTYGESKLEAEQGLMSMAALPYLIFRPTAVFGPRDTEMLAVFKIIKSGIAPRIGFSKQLLTFIYIKDLAKLFVDATISAVSQSTYFVSDGNVYDSKTFNEKVAKALNKSILSLKVPVGIIQFGAEIAQIYSKITGASTVLNREKVNELKARSWAVDITPQIKDFNYQSAYSLDEALKETVDWYKKHNWL